MFFQEISQVSKQHTFKSYGITIFIFHMNLAHKFIREYSFWLTHNKIALNIPEKQDQASKLLPQIGLQLVIGLETVQKAEQDVYIACVLPNLQQYHQYMKESVIFAQQHSQATLKTKQDQQSVQDFCPKSFAKNSKKKIVKIINNVTIFYFDADGCRKSFVYQHLSEKVAKKTTNMLKRAQKTAQQFAEKTRANCLKEMERAYCAEQLKSLIVPMPTYPTVLYGGWQENGQTVE